MPTFCVEFAEGADSQREIARQGATMASKVVGKLRHLFAIRKIRWSYRHNPVENLIKARSRSLGFNIRGGVDAPHIQGDCGIFVTKIREDGSAFKDGQLKEGDKVLEVNGVDLSQVTHQEAVACFINSGEDVNMKVQQGAEAVITKRLEDSMVKQSKTSTPDDKGGSWKLPMMLLFLGVAGAGAFWYWRKRFR
ncbi:synaptojanin-2-binding protein-like [Pecten maximus]|uniref:synaptojanin-2-binding protein-like n=1 Tax=Pecten maximus TaxID=6579 RepID=UPI001458D833|nr:synaptojanin-2-binding protein-like [Pecten maximus]